MATKTISKGRMLRITVEIDDSKLEAMKAAPELARQALQAGADYWHSKILPKHFEPGAGIVYGYAARTRDYLKQRKKVGKPLLVYSGSLRRDLKTQATFKIGAKSVIELKMSARVLNLVPNMADSNVDAYVKRKNNHGYPNLKREIRAITDDERAAVAAVVTQELERLMNAEATSKASSSPTM